MNGRRAAFNRCRGNLRGHTFVDTSFRGAHGRVTTRLSGTCPHPAESFQHPAQLKSDE